MRLTRRGRLAAYTAWITLWTLITIGPLAWAAHADLTWRYIP